MDLSRVSNLPEVRVGGVNPLPHGCVRLLADQAWARARNRWQEDWVSRAVENGHLIRSTVDVLAPLRRHLKEVAAIGLVPP